MKKIIYGNVAQAPFYITTESKQLSQCTPDNPFGVQRRSPPELRPMEGVHYTSDPIAEKIRVLRALQKANDAAIGVAVATNVYASIKAIQIIGALIWATGIIRAALGYVDNVIGDMLDEKDKLYYEKAPDTSNIPTSDTSERIDRYKDRQDIKSNTTEGGGTTTSDPNE
ncbi:hypothetical protein [Achromobacter aegrifaciens]